MGIYDFALFTGHGQYGIAYDPGSVGIKNGGRIEEHHIAALLVAAAKVYLDKTEKNILYGVNNYKNNLLNGHTITSKSALSVHLNSVGNPSVCGTEVWVPAKESYLMHDESLCSGIASCLGTPDRGLRSSNFDLPPGNWVPRVHGTSVDFKDYYGEIRTAWNYGVALSILETGFISHEPEIHNILGKVNEIGRLIAKYACDCMGVAFPEDTPSVSEPNYKNEYNNLFNKYTELLVELHELRDKVQKIKDIVR